MACASSRSPIRMATYSRWRNGWRELFVTQGFYRIEPGSLDRRQHAADNADESKDRGGNNQNRGIDVQVNIGILRIFRKGAEECQASHRVRDRVGDHYAEDTAN